MVKAALTPFSDSYESAVSWFTTHFEDCADNEPNRVEHQLDVIDKTELYQIYVVDTNLDRLDSEVLSYSEWLRVWGTVFPFVKVRAYKQVTGKCWVCFHINDGRRRCKDQASKKALKQLHQLHRGGLFMLERNTYKARAKFATANSDRIMSLIIDGMDQQHCLIPHMANQTSLSEALHQHLTGVIMHGREAVLYRTFGNVSKGANLTIYCILCQLEKWVAEHNGAFPDELYVQVDGGSENANKYVLAVLELLTVKRLVRVVYMTRLPTGHTHEDIDAIFAKIWEWFKSNSVLSPQEYATELKAAFQQSASVHLKNICVEDIFIIPDMVEFLQRHIDPKLAKLHTKLHTQHQWRFEAVAVSGKFAVDCPKLMFLTTPAENFPLGAKSMYRAYVNDTVVEIRKLPKLQCTTPIGQITGLEPSTTHCRLEPAADTVCAVNRVEVMHILYTHPYSDATTIVPSSFEDGWRKEMDTSLRAIFKHKTCV